MKREIIITPAEYEAIDAAIDTLAQADDIFVYNDQLWRRLDSGFRRLDAAYLRYRLSELIDFVVVKPNGKRVAVHVPHWLVPGVMARRSYDDLPRLVMSERDRCLVEAAS